MNKLSATRIVTTALIALITNGAFSQGLFDPNLALRVLCISPYSVGSKIEGDAQMTARLTARVTNELERRFTLSRVDFKKTSSCGNALFAQINVETTSGPTRGVLVEARLTELGSSYPAPIILWTSSTFGSINLTGLALEDLLFETMRDRIEDLAIAWIKANP